MLEGIPLLSSGPDTSKSSMFFISRILVHILEIIYLSYSTPNFTILYNYWNFGSPVPLKSREPPTLRPSGSFRYTRTAQVEIPPTLRPSGSSVTPVPSSQITTNAQTFGSSVTPVRSSRENHQRSDLRGVPLHPYSASRDNHHAQTFGEFRYTRTAQVERTTNAQTFGEFRYTRLPLKENHQRSDLRGVPLHPYRSSRENHQRSTFGEFRYTRTLKSKSQSERWYFSKENQSIRLV